MLLLRSLQAEDGDAMKWRLKDRNNDRAIISDCGKYQISRYTPSDCDLFMVFHGSTEIGTASTGNSARKIAIDHAKRATA